MTAVPGTGLNDCWKVMGGVQRSAGGFIWALVGEGVVRDGRGGAIDTTGNRAPEGILGPFREREASFHTIRDIWAPLQLTNPGYYASTFPAGFDKTVEVVNNYGFTNVSQCGFTWRLLRYNSPGSGSGRSIVAEGAFTGPDIAPGARSALSLDLPADWATADALTVTTRDPSGRQVGAWTWRIKKAAEHAARLVVPSRAVSPRSRTPPR
ncbi:hypothetical protein [Lentzea sp. NPDC059081]|uniref:hypothetical protein n=1 Tax=Lentzea sp. NPDC059081 TaxID=3346719 RepID=UPI0036BE3062